MLNLSFKECNFLQGWPSIPVITSSAMAENDQVAPGIYRHYKGKNYKVIGVGMHTESEEKLVLYQSQYGNFDLWARPVSMWNEEVDYEGQTLPRFMRIEQ